MLLVVRPGAPSSVLVTTSKALVTSSDALVPSSVALAPSAQELRSFLLGFTAPFDFRTRRHGIFVRMNEGNRSGDGSPNCSERLLRRC